MKSLEMNIIYENPIPQLRSRQAAFPNICQLADGTLLSAMLIGEAFESADGASFLCRSTDGGKTWSKPQRMFDPNQFGRPYSGGCKVTALPDHIFDVGGVAVGEGKLFAGKHPAVEIPSATLVVRVHKSDVAEIAIKAGCFTRTEGIVCAALTVPSRFVVEPTEKAVRVRADVKTEGPDASARTDSVGIADARKGAVGVTDTEIGLYLPSVLHIVKTSARKHRDVPHVRVTAHRPKLAVGVAVHRRSAVLINAEAVEKRRFGSFGYA